MIYSSGLGTRCPGQKRGSVCKKGGSDRPRKARVLPRGRHHSPPRHPCLPRPAGTRLCSGCPPAAVLTAQPTSSPSVPRAPRLALFPDPLPQSLPATALPRGPAPPAGRLLQTRRPSASATPLLASAPRQLVPVSLTPKRGASPGLCQPLLPGSSHHTPCMRLLEGSFSPLPIPAPKHQLRPAAHLTPHGVHGELLMLCPLPRSEICAPASASPLAATPATRSSPPARTGCPRGSRLQTRQLPPTRFPDRLRREKRLKSSRRVKTPGRRKEEYTCVNDKVHLR